MERGSKRKSGAAALSASSPSEGRAAKRQKTPEPPLTLKLTTNKAATTPASNKKTTGALARETVESTTQTGQKFLEQLKNARDKNGRLIATSFLTLPKRNQLPEYYEHIKLPISIETIQEKLLQGEFSTLTQVESDMKRMVNNAKSFNETKSEVYLDAERVRKMTSNFMLKNNPAYKDKSYTAFPTPIPDEADNIPAEEESPVPTSKSRTRSKAVEEQSPALKSKVGARSKAAEEQSPANEVADEVVDEVADEVVDEVVDNVADGVADQVVDNETENPIDVEEPVNTKEPMEGEEKSDGTFDGKTFQEAQEQIVTEMIEFKDDSGLAIFTPFINLPARALTDYYAVIKQPTSLNGIRKKVRGVRGRGETTGVTDLKSWDAYEAEFCRIWNNAREYNQDGSEMFLLAGELEDHFRERLVQAKKVVGEPQQPTLKLNLSSKPSAPIKLRLGPGGSGSPAPSAVATETATATATAAATTTATARKAKTQSPVPVAAPSISNATSAKNTPAPNGVNIDQSSLKRQQEDVQAGVNGASTPNTSRARSASRVALRSSSRGAGSPAIEVNGIKAESNNEQSPASNANHPSSSTPEAVNGVVQTDTQAQTDAQAKASSLPPSTQSMKNTSESPAPTNTSQDPKQIWIPMHPPPTGMESRFRANGKDASDALIRNVHISSHPDLPITRPFHQDIPPHASLTQQSITLNLPATHYNLRLQTELAPVLTHDLSVNPSLANVQLGSTGSNRPYKLFVTVNGQRMLPVVNATASQVAGNSYVATTANMTSMSPPPSTDVSKSSGPATELKPFYEVKLLPGLNRVEVECVATPPPSSVTSGASSTNSKHDLEMERVTIFVHLLRVSI